MKKIIKLPIESTTQIRKTEDSLCELYSHDKNNGLFEFEVTNVKLGNEKPYAMFKFMDSMSVWKVLGTIEDNKIKVSFDTTLITQDETVVCFLYLDDEERTTDFYRFKFKVKVSEIDKLHTYAVKERYFNNSIIVDKLDVVTKDELKEALKGLTVSTVEGVLTETRADELYAKKTDLYDDTDLSNRVKKLEDAPKINATDFATKNDLVAFNGELNNKVSSVDFEDFKRTIPAPYNDKTLSDRVLALENKPSVGQTQDTGWITVSDDNPLHGNIVKIRRINDIVHVSLSNPHNEGLQLELDSIEFCVILANKEIPNGFTPLKDITIQVTNLENYMKTMSAGTDVIGQVVYKIENNKIVLNVYGDKFITGTPTSALINDFSYFTEDPFPVELQK